MNHIKKLKYDCRYFRGYRPCDFAKKEVGLDCWDCKEYYEPYDKKVLIIKQGEIGDVLRTTPLARAIKEKWPQSYIVWLVEGKSEQFIINNEYVDEVVVYHPSQLLRFMTERFDLLICLDKDIASTTIATLANAKKKVGFSFDKRGFVYPLNKEAHYKFIIGASDTLNKKNKMSYMEQIYQITGLQPSTSEYVLDLTTSAKEFGEALKKKHNIKKTDIVIGFNHGCGSKFQSRKWPLEYYATLAKKIFKDYKKVKIIILGGPYEKETNKLLYKMIKPFAPKTNSLIDSGTDNNIMDFCGLINICDIVVTSNTMAMHVAIALRKKMVVFMGPIVKSEINTFGLGPILTSTKHDCLGCFKDECDKKPSCMEAIDPGMAYKEILIHFLKMKVKNEKRAE